MSGVDALLASLPSWTLVGGKGGVGKTTCAAALALRAAALDPPALVLSTDPAGALGDVLGVALGSEPREVPGAPGLHAAQLDAAAARRAFLDRSREMLITIVDRGTYLDREDIAGLVDAALPGADEAMAMLTLADIGRRSEWRRVFIDTAPTGHTLRLLSLPDTFRALVELLDRMQGKHRFMVSALTHRYRADAVDAFLEELRGQVATVRSLLTDASRTGVVLVTRPEPLVAAETARYASALADLGLAVRALVSNAMPVRHGEEGAAALSLLEHVARGLQNYHVPVLHEPPTGLAGVARWGDAVVAGAGATAASSVTSSGGGAPGSRDPAGRASGRRTGGKLKHGVGTSLDTLPAAGPGAIPLRSVTVVGGKGGVGKTSVSCALALESAASGKRTLLVSTDPAPSIGDALALEIGDAERGVPDAHGLVARQIDATAAFARWRAEYQARVDEVFASLRGGAIDAAHDREIARDLLALAPPGIDELYALIWLGDTVDESRFDHVVIDPAPTGHLLRLLEMPALALDWSHRLLRLMLKYRELAGGGETSAELLAFARRTRAVGELLHDPARSGVIVVALAEPLVRAETERLIARVRSLRIDVPAVIWNRVTRAPAPLTVRPAVAQFVAIDSNSPPIGAARLAAWRREWKALPRHDR